MSETAFKNLFVPVVPQDIGGEDGNNVIIPPPVNALYKYDFVINNYTENEVFQLKTSIQKLAKKAILGFEVGESGTPHIQGCIFLLRKMRIVALTSKAGFERASCRAIRNPQACEDYCRKENDYWQFGYPKAIKVIENLYPWQKEIFNIYLTEPDDRKIYWFWEDVGKIGKTQFIKYMAVKHSILFCAGGEYRDIMNLVFNQDMDNCNAVIFDIPRAHQGKISYASLECIKNGMVCNTKYETGVKIFNAPHIFIFANFPPECPEKMSSDRWIIKEL